MNHLHVNGWGCTLLRLIHIMAHRNDIEALRVRCAHFLHIAACLCWLIGIADLWVNIRLLHLYCLPLHLTSWLRGINPWLSVTGRLLCRVHHTVLPLVVVYFRDSLLNLGNIYHRLLIRPIRRKTDISLRHLYLRVGSWTTQNRLRFSSEFLLSDSAYWLLDRVLLHLLLELLNVSFLALIQNGLLIVTWDSCHILLHYPLVQGDLSECRRIRLRMRLWRFDTRGVSFLHGTRSQHLKEVVPLHIRRIVYSFTIIFWIIISSSWGDGHVRVVKAVEVRIVGRGLGKLLSLLLLVVESICHPTMVHISVLVWGLIEMIRMNPTCTRGCALVGWH